MFKFSVAFLGTVVFASCGNRPAIPLVPAPPLNAVVELQPTSASVKIISNAGALGKAEKALTMAIEIEPQAYEAYYYLGNVWVVRENLDNAKEQYEAALTRVPRYPEALYALGMVLGEKHEFDSALEKFEQVLKITSRHPGAYFWRAVILAERMQFEEALSDCDRAIQLYDEQIAVLTMSIERAEKRGLSRRAAAESRKKTQVEETRQRAAALRDEVRSRKTES